MKKYLVLPLVLFLLLLNINVVHAGITGLAVIGDSFSDEYRAEDNRGGAYASTTFNWLELLQKYRSVNVGEWGTRSDSRRTGYEYNFAQSGDTVADVITQGQHTKVAQLISEGKISHVVIHVGANDFALWNNTYSQVYNGTTTSNNQKVTNTLANFATILTTLKSAGNSKIIIANLADRSVLPTFIAAFPDSTKRQKVTNTIISLNNGIKNLADSNGVVLADQYNLGNLVLSKIDSQGNYVISGEKISFTVDGDEPHHMLLGDHEHAGTVMSGVVANLLYIPAFQLTGTNISTFSDNEILQMSGIRAVPSITPTKLPTPSTSPSISSKFDVNKDSKVDLLDVIAVLAEIFK